MVRLALAVRPGGMLDGIVRRAATWVVGPGGASGAAGFRLGG